MSSRLKNNSKIVSQINPFHEQALQNQKALLGRSPPNLIEILLFVRISTAISDAHGGDPDLRDTHFIPAKPDHPHRLS